MVIRENRMTGSASSAQEGRSFQGMLLIVVKHSKDNPICQDMISQVCNVYNLKSARNDGQ